MFDPYEIKVLTITGLVIVVFIFSILFAVTDSNSEVPGCVPFDKTYTNPRVNKIDDSTYQVFAVA